MSILVRSTLLLLYSLFPFTQGLSAKLSTIQGSARLNLSFSENITYPKFQIFSTLGDVHYTPQDTSPNTYFVLQPSQPKIVLMQQVYVIFNEPYAVGSGDLDLASFVVDTFAATNGINVIPLSYIIATAVVIAITVTYGRAGLMCVAFVQIYVVSSRYSVFLKMPQNEMEAIFLFNWHKMQIPGLDPEMFLNTSISMLVLLAGAVVLCLLSLLIFRKATSNLALTVKSFFVFNLVIILMEIMFLPLTANISKNFSVEATSGHNQPVTAIRVVNNIVCVLFLCLVLGYVGFYIWFMNSSRINLYSAEIIRPFHRMYNGLELRKWYTRSFHVCKLLSYMMVGLLGLLPNPIYVVVIMQTIILFFVLTIRPYHLKGYTAFSITLQTAVLIEFIFICLEALFQNLSVSILGYSGTLILNVITASIFFLIVLGSLAFSTYQGIVMVKGFLREQRIKKEEQRILIFDRSGPKKKVKELEMVKTEEILNQYHIDAKTLLFNDKNKLINAQQIVI